MYARIKSLGWASLLACAIAQGQELDPTAPPPLPAAPLPADGSAGDVEVLTRGPVHEAFAEQISPDPVEGLVAPAKPPAPVQEVPPDLRPEGDDIVWIPGYWFWDDERNDYVWVSGFWRREPPGRRWIPGYWLDVEAGHQWISGFWGPDTAGDVGYLETPPESLEIGPSTPEPSATHFWSPGFWDWNHGQFRWRPGSWTGFRDGWTWVAPRYVWTPHGCIFVSGYWDHPLTLRGHLFAPVCFRSPVYLRRGFTYRPTCWIGYEPLLLHLFVRPHCHHLYFGDYYAPLYRTRHFTPCYAYHQRFRGFSSLYVYYQHHYRRHGIDYCGRVRDWHDYYMRHTDHRPAHTFHSQVAHLGRGSLQHRRVQDELARPYATRASERIAGRQLATVSLGAKTQFLSDSDRLRDLSRQRRLFEVASQGQPLGKGRSSSSRLGIRDSLKLPELQATSGKRAIKSVRKVPAEIVRANRHLRATEPLVGGSNPARTTIADRILAPTARQRGNLVDATSQGGEQAGRKTAREKTAPSTLSFRPEPRPRPSLGTHTGSSTPSSSNNPIAGPRRSSRIGLPLASGTALGETAAGPRIGPRVGASNGEARLGPTNLDTIRARIRGPSQSELARQLGQTLGSRSGKTPAGQAATPGFRKPLTQIHSQSFTTRRSAMSPPASSQTVTTPRRPMSGSAALRDQFRGLGIGPTTTTRSAPPTARGFSSPGKSSGAPMTRRMGSRGSASSFSLPRASSSSGSIGRRLGSGSGSSLPSSLGRRGGAVK